MQDHAPQVTPPSRNGLRIGIISVIVVIVLIATVVAINSAKTNQQTTADSQLASPADSNTTTGVTYRDGTYTAEGSYNTPESQETISVTLTIKDNIVTGTELTGKASKRDSVEYMNAFAGGYKAVVVGKDINSLQLGRVSGSSLTPIGFNAAVAKIRTQAKAS